MADLTEEFKTFYKAGKTPELLIVRPLPFATLEGEGDPNDDEFGPATAAVCSFSNTFKMSYKNNEVPAGYYEYKVFPLEGV